jgi:hypothetical protein
MYRLHPQVARNRRARKTLAITAANVVPSSPILVALMMKARRSSQTSVSTRVAWRNIPEGGILQSPPRKPQIMQHSNMLEGFRASYYELRRIIFEATSQL